MIRRRLGMSMLPRRQFTITRATGCKMELGRIQSHCELARSRMRRAEMYAVLDSVNHTTHAFDEQCPKRYRLAIANNPSRPSEAPRWMLARMYVPAKCCSGRGQTSVLCRSTTMMSGPTVAAVEIEEKKNPLPSGPRTTATQAVSCTACPARVLPRY